MMESYTILSLLLCLSVASAFSNNAILNDPVPLGLESYVIPDSSLTASSEYNADHGAKRGRLNLARVGNLRGAWSARTNNANQWIQVDLADIYRIISVATQGRQDYSQWVTSYKLACSTDGTTFHTIQDISTNPGADKIFTGNVDRNTIVTNTLPVPQICRYVRLMPVRWFGHISLRMEIYGEGPLTAILNDPVPLGLESYVIPDSSLTASSEYNADHGAKRGRLNLARVGNLRGAWSARTNDANQWIQVDLADIYRIMSVATQGRQDLSQWVTSYKLACSTDGTTFHTIQDISTNPGADKIFSGNVDRNTIVTNTLPVPQICRYVRLMPVSWFRHISLRMEIYGEGPLTGASSGPDVRLVGTGSSASQGRVEVYSNGRWGTVCDDLWGLQDANVVCRQLGFPGASDFTTQADTFGAGSGDILLDNVACVGDETSIMDCQKNAIGVHNCRHSEDAGVICRVQGGSSGGSSEPVIRLGGMNKEAELGWGLVEVYRDGQWGTVCGLGWTQQDANVACRQLGFTGNAFYHFDVDEWKFFGSGTGPILLNDVRCTGDEASIMDCPAGSTENPSCTHEKDAEVQCLEADKKRKVEDLEFYEKEDMTEEYKKKVAAEEGYEDKKDADLKKKDVLQALSDLLAELKDK